MSPRITSLRMCHPFFWAFLEGAPALTNTRAFLALGSPRDPLTLATGQKAVSARVRRLKYKKVKRQKRYKDYKKDLRVLFVP